MRTPADLPQRRRAPRGRVGLVAVAVILFVVLTSLRGIAGFYTDYLWFEEVELTSVWRGVLGAKVVLVAVFAGVFFGLLWLSLTIADRIAPRFRPIGPEDELVQRYREIVGPHAGKVRLAVSALFAVLAGSGVAGEWESWLLFANRVDFGVTDPQFDRDVGFYVFDLPFLTFVVDWLFVAFVIITVVTVVAHYLNGGIRLQIPGQRVTPRVKAHISVLLGALALAKAAGYFLQRYELNFSTRGAVHGATYTDVNAQLPAVNLLIFISLAAFALFILNIWRQGWVLPVIGVGLWVLISVIVGGVYPAFIQQFRVEPDEPRREKPYIERNIEATRAAYGLDAVKTTNFAYDEDLTAADLEKNAATIRNVRLWDPDPTVATRTFQKLQEIRGYYRFNDADIDRYVVDGELTQVIVSVRELNTSDLPSQSWVNRHLQYTHGYGLVLAPANAVDRDGQPQFLVKDVPPQGQPELAQPRVYYGERTGSYAVVRTDRPEIDFPKAGGGDQTHRYEGRGGVPLNSVLRRAAFALRFANINLLLSGDITSESRAIYIRDITDRVRNAAPFLRYDADPYPVIIDGRIKWVIDGYTVSSHYPYAQRANDERVPQDSGLRGSFNYVRNSVKVTVDAYDGDMTFYRFDEDDPIAAAYAKAFPDLFTPRSEMPAELVDHLRYPEDLFRVQTNMYGRYHIEDPDEFYNAGDAWHVSQDPGTGSPSGPLQSTATTDVRGNVVAARQRRMDPTYLLMRLPGEERESFLILQPFVPSSQGDKQQNLASFLVAKSEPDDYGELTAFVMPRGRQIDGPALVDARIAADPEISQQISLLDQRGSEVLLGNVLVVPIEQSLLYVRPLYVQSERNPVPEFRKAIVVFGDQVAMANTLQQALTEVFGAAPETREEADGRGEGNGEGEQPDIGVTVQQLLERAQQAFAAAEDALRAGDLAEYQKRIREGVDLVRRAREAAAPPTTTTTATTQA